MNLNNVIGRVTVEKLPAGKHKATLTSSQCEVVSYLGIDQPVIILNYAVGGLSFSLKIPRHGDNNEHAKQIGKIMKVSAGNQAVMWVYIDGAGNLTKDYNLAVDFRAANETDPREMRIPLTEFCFNGVYKGLQQYDVSVVEKIFNVQLSELVAFVREEGQSPMLGTAESHSWADKIDASKEAKELIRARRLATLTRI
jgi:hypothetical protein